MQCLTGCSTVSANVLPMINRLLYCVCHRPAHDKQVALLLSANVLLMINSCSTVYVIVLAMLLTESIVGAFVLIDMTP